MRAPPIVIHMPRAFQISSDHNKGDETAMDYENSAEQLREELLRYALNSGNPDKALQYVEKIRQGAQVIDEILKVPTPPKKSDLKAVIEAQWLIDNGFHGMIQHLFDVKLSQALAGLGQAKEENEELQTTLVAIEKRLAALENQR